MNYIKELERLMEENKDVLIRLKEGKIKKKMWEDNAIHVENIYGAFVDWEERYYLCPECGEPIYETDWSEDELAFELCPVCGFDD